MKRRKIKVDDNEPPSEWTGVTMTPRVPAKAVAALLDAVLDRPCPKNFFCHHEPKCEGAANG